MRNQWQQSFVPGAKIKITGCTCGLFDVGAVLVVDRVNEAGTLHYNYAEGVWITKGGERFPLWKMFYDCEGSLEAFGDGSVEWEVVSP